MPSASGADGEDGVGGVAGKGQRVELESDILGAGEADLEVVLTLGESDVAGEVRERQAGDEGLSAVGGDVDRGSVRAEVHDAHLGHALLKGEVVVQDHGGDVGNETGGGDGGHGSQPRRADRPGR